MKTFKLPLVSLLGALVVIGTGGCAAEGSSIHIANAFPLSTDSACTVNNTISQYGGSLDIAGSFNYDIDFEVRSDIQPIATVRNNIPTDFADRGDFVAEALHFRYTSTPPIAIPDAVEPIFFTIAPGGTSQVRMLLLSPDAAQALFDGLAPGDSVQLNIEMYITGKLYSQQEHKSQTITFPITVYNSGFTGCTGTGNRRAPTGPCGAPGGQDGTAVGCCNDPAFATVCGT